ncbi:MAG TPA: hypothetical protein VLK03_05765, partial [Nocardioides sp.]|nr:hypothetical protein [Nocardioides sp.]
YAGTGRAPFGRGPAVAIMDRVRRGEHDLSGLDPLVLPLVEEALAPSAADRPSLDEVRDWLEDLADPSSEPPGAPPRVTRLDAPMTQPMVASMHEDLAAPTRVGSAAAGPLHWSEAWTTDPGDDLHDDPDDDFHDHPDDDPDDDPAHHWREQGTVPQRHTRVLPDGTTEYVSTEYGPVRERVPAGQRLRRSATLLAGAGVVTAAIALAPYVAVAVIFFVVWLLRSGSMAAASAGNRRSRRGIKWYDGIQLLLAAPWHVVAGLGGTVLLLLWSLGIGAAVALLCFAGAVSMTTSLVVIGAAFAVGLWWGPGSERFRSPVHRAVDPLARRGVPWLLVTLLVAAAASGLGGAVAAQGTTWAPDDAAPLSDVRLPGWL